MDTEGQHNNQNNFNCQNRSPPLHYFNFLNFSQSPPLTQYKGQQQQQQSLKRKQIIQSKQTKFSPLLNDKEVQINLLKIKDQIQIQRQKQMQIQYEKERIRQKQRLKAEQAQKHRQEQIQRFQSLNKKEKVEVYKQISKEQVLEQKRQQQHYNLMMFLGKKLQQRRQFQDLNVRILHQLLNEQQFRNLPQLQKQKVSKAYQSKLSQRERDFVKRQLAQIQSYKQEIKKRIQGTLKQSKQELERQKIILEMNRNRLDELDKKISQQEIFIKSTYQNQSLSQQEPRVLIQPLLDSVIVNNDNNLSIKDIQSSKVVVNVNNQPPPDTMRGQIYAVGKWLLSFRQDWRALKSDLKNSHIYIQCRDKTEQFSNKYEEPIKRLYRNLPSIMTEAKYQLICEYQFKKRLLFLTSLSIISGLGSLYWWSKHPGLRVLRMTKSSFITFIVGGIFIAPQIYYKFMKQNSQKLPSLDKTDSKDQIKNNDD